MVSTCIIILIAFIKYAKSMLVVTKYIWKQCAAYEWQIIYKLINLIDLIKILDCNL
jgi:hypothetical protein